MILLSARDDVTAKVEGLDLGADDYVTKPFWLEELRARVRAQLRGPRQASSALLQAGDLTVDLTTRRVVHAGHEVALTAREYALLVYLLRHPDQVLSREQLLHAVWGLDFDPRTKVLDVYVGYLRRKLAVAGRPAPIETVRQVGYRLRVRPCADHRRRRPARPGTGCRLAWRLALAVGVVLGADPGRGVLGGGPDDGAAPAGRPRRRPADPGPGVAAQRGRHPAGHPRPGGTAARDLAGPATRPPLDPAAAGRRRRRVPADQPPRAARASRWRTSGPSRPTRAARPRRHSDRRHPRRRPGADHGQQRRPGPGPGGHRTDHLRRPGGRHRAGRRLPRPR